MAPGSRTFAFVAHQSLSLNDSRVVHITSQAKKIALFGWKDGELRADIRVDWAPLKAGNADEALCSFCQKIWLRGLATDPGTLAGSSIVAQNLFQAFDNKLSFKREMLSFGLQGLQELDWSKQNAVLMDDNQRTKQSANESRVRFGPDDRFLLDIDTGMLEARGVVKFKIHDMDIEQPQQKKSYQLFVDVKHTDFVQAFGDEVKGQPNPWETFGRIARLALIIFEEAFAYMKDPANCTEHICLLQSIKKGEFLRKSVEWDVSPAEQIPLLVALDDTMDHIHAPNPTKEKSQPSSPQPLTPSSSSSASSSPAPMVDQSPPKIAEAPVSKARAKKLRQKQRMQERQERQREQEAAEGDKESETNVIDTLDGQLSGLKLATPTTSNAAAAASSPQRELGGEAGDVYDGPAQANPAVSDSHSDVGVSEVDSQMSDTSDRTITKDNFNQGIGREGPSTPTQSSRATDATRMTEVVENKPVGNQAGSLLGSSTSLALPFKFDSFHPRLKCPKQDCGKMTSCWDSVVVICPACGPNSFTRYCCKEHLYEDVQRHWLYDCGKLLVNGPVDKTTIRPSQLPRTSYITGHFSNHIERHRQAIYRGMEPADYFIFDDDHHLSSDTPTKEEWNLVRGTGKVLKTVSFINDGTLLSPHAFFNHHMLQCLKFGGPLALNSCNIAFHMIRDFLIVEGSWSEDILTTLCMQIAFEWGYKVPEHFYNVDAVNAAYRDYGVRPLPLPFQQV